MFEEFNLTDEIMNAIKDLGFTNPTDIQCQAIPMMLEGVDIVGRSKTGSGKTLAFGIPLVQMLDNQLRRLQSIIICPTRELAMQVGGEIKKVTKYKPFEIVEVYGGANMQRQIRELKTAQIVVATPGRLMDHMRRRTIKLDDIKCVVLDEADEMLDMGFREDIEYILKYTPKSRQTVMFSATIPTSIRGLTKLYMKKPEFIELGQSNAAIEQIEQSYIICGLDKKVKLTELFLDNNIASAIIFTNTKRMAEAVNIHLVKNKINSKALHGDMRQNERKRVMTDIKSHKVSVLVATDVASRGIDISNVEYVINYDLPNDVESYLHRIGRTGRAGNEGKAVTLINEKEEFNKLNMYKNRTNSKLVANSLSLSDEEFSQKAKKPPFAPRSRQSRLRTRRR